MWELMAGVGSAFISGADRAYLHELLRNEGREKDFRRTEGSARGVFQISQGIGSVVGGLLGAISLKLPLLGTGLATIISSGVGLSFSVVQEKIGETKLTYRQTITSSFKVPTKSIYVFALWSLFNTLIFMNLTIVADQVLKIVDPKQAATVLSIQSFIWLCAFSAARIWWFAFGGEAICFPGGYYPN